MQPTGKYQIFSLCFSSSETSHMLGCLAASGLCNLTSQMKCLWETLQSLRLLGIYSHSNASAIVPSVPITVGTEVCIPKALLQSTLTHCKSISCSLILWSVIPMFLLYPVTAQMTCCRDCNIVPHQFHGEGRIMLQHVMKIGKNQVDHEQVSIS